MFDICAGVAADIGHINTKSTVTGYQPDANGLKNALSGSEIVLIPAGVPRKPGMTRDGTLSVFLFDHLDSGRAVADNHRSLQHQRFDSPRLGESCCLFCSRRQYSCYLQSGELYRPHLRRNIQVGRRLQS